MIKISKVVLILYIVMFNSCDSESVVSTQSNTLPIIDNYYTLYIFQEQKIVLYSTGIENEKLLTNKIQNCGPYDFTIKNVEVSLYVNPKGLYGYNPKKVAENTYEINKVISSYETEMVELTISSVDFDIDSGYEFSDIVKYELEIVDYSHYGL